jgi:drug/metabolite transporter (DMT)-like permease
VLVLWACFSTPIAVVSALRETSVIFALLLGTVLLKEKLTIMKVLVTFIILTGVITLRLA